MTDSRANEGEAAILFVDDELNNLTLFRLHFGGEMPLFTAQSGREALELLEREDVCMVLTDERMPGMSGIELLATLVDRHPDVVRVIVSAYSDAERVLRAINQGHAHEYVVKPWTIEEMRGCIARGREVARRRRELRFRAEMSDALHEDLQRDHDAARMVRGSGAFAQTAAAALRAAEGDSTVLLLGETGTGKEMLARSIHDASPRKAGPFVRVDCASLAEGVLESELFGHERGAFTGAVRTRRGRFELAQRGTIFLDEIGDISAHAQLALLRVLQERELERVGGNASIRVDVRVIAATHQDLEARVASGQFRQDLYYRLNVIPILVPPLRDRRGDIPELLAHMVAKHSPRRPPPRVTDEALSALTRYGWPGNVRELENVVERALVMSTSDELTLEDFCLDLRAAVPAPGNVREEARSAEQEELRALLLEHGGNCARAARALGIPRTTLLARAKKHGLL
ncbi:MAG: sigma-54-dependent Fis family transcriptional regulator [Myxococcales bacterium]|nr:sigma-54-dependent Fis family transcriptional regulator [Myxococcales bacterium]